MWVLMHGDLVLADRGFDISEELALHGATLATTIPEGGGRVKESFQN